VIDDQEDVPVLAQLVAEVRTYPELEQEIHHCIDDRGDVADRASPKLAGFVLSLSQYETGFIRFSREFCSVKAVQYSNR
jgi:DNA mismatch repair protein MutS2